MTTLHWQDHHTHLVLPTPPEFRFSAVLGYLTRSTNECLFHVEEEKVYKLLPLESEDVLVEVSHSATDSGLLVRFLHKNPNEPELREQTAQYVREWFDLDRDLQPFYDLAEDDPVLREVVQEHYGLRIVGVPDLFEALCWAILGQQINLAFAYTLKRRFVETYGRKVEWEGRTYWLFPRPADVADLTVDALRDLQFTTKKAEYVIGVAHLMSQGTLSKQHLHQLDNLRAIEKELVKIRGIGPWTAHYVIMRCLRLPAAFPLEDVGLHNAIKHVLHLDSKPTRQELLDLSEGWGEWKAYATFYLWRMLY
ncbi:DNA-3-methyladenine glycosylase 2 [Tumebacillus sp. ITR2]|uniref:DNA-3-methyladenine glycosylase II n=1 Tax=Tumebacillus amylolyticus TaxID=2801339 RepID=A0ABS1J676_9BACL|nr:DNA-3-methyladenine glycosylase 2 [Tumebacillus amylolyticus]